MYLEMLGHKIVGTAASGRRAISAYKNHKPDLVTMDISMPEMDGIEATRSILSEFPDAKVVMVTSLGQEKVVLSALKAGATGYVLKPFDSHKVHEAIQKAWHRVVIKERLPSEVGEK